LAGLLTSGGIDAVVHCAAVSDYLSGGVYAPEEGTSFIRENGKGHWLGSAGPGPGMVDKQAAKIRSDEEELWVRLVRAPKLVDQIREPWGFRGLLVKFKLEVGVDDDHLLRVAEASRTHSRADLMVANTLENAARYAFLGPFEGKYEKVVRSELSARLIEELEQRHPTREKGRG
jgi:phosphopantothenoylcysteine synthetase/decarboxylase